MLPPNINTVATFAYHMPHRSKPNSREKLRNLHFVTCRIAASQIPEKIRGFIAKLRFSNRQPS
jgi:hypothetical protein